MKTFVYDLAKTVKIPNAEKTIAIGIKPVAAPKTTGFHVLTPAQTASLGVDLFSIEHKNGGYQRELKPNQVWKIARQMEADYPMPPILYAILEDGSTQIIDGQHRALGSVAAGRNLWAVAIEADLPTQKRLFSAQSAGINVEKGHLVLIGDGVINRYVNDACRSPEGKHPWAGLVAKRANKHHMSASQMYHLVGTLTLGLSATNSGWEKQNDPRVVEEKWNPINADILGELIAAFGPKAQNKLAHAGTSLRAITNVARRTIFARPDGRARSAEITRWKTHMPKFKFDDNIWALSSTDLTEQLLVAHWNKGGLAADRKA